MVEERLDAPGLLMEGISRGYVVCHVACLPHLRVAGVVAMVQAAMLYIRSRMCFGLYNHARWLIEMAESHVQQIPVIPDIVPAYEQTSNPFQFQCRIGRNETISTPGSG